MRVRLRLRARLTVIDPDSGRCVHDSFAYTPKRRRSILKFLSSCRLGFGRVRELEFCRRDSKFLNTHRHDVHVFYSNPMYSSRGELFTLVRYFTYSKRYDPRHALIYSYVYKSCIYGWWGRLRMTNFCLTMTLITGTNVDRTASV